MNLLMNFSMILFIMGVLVIISNRKHLLSILLSLEYMILSLFIYLYLSIMGFELYFGMLFLTLSVCEGSLGISIFVSMIRIIVIIIFKSLVQFSDNMVINNFICYTYMFI